MDLNLGSCVLQGHCKLRGLGRSCFPFGGPGLGAALLNLLPSHWAHWEKGGIGKRPCQVWGDPTAEAGGLQAARDAMVSLHCITMCKTGAGGLCSLPCREQDAPCLALLPCTPELLCGPTGSRVEDRIHPGGGSQLKDRQGATLCRSSAALRGCALVISKPFPVPH